MTDTKLASPQAPEQPQPVAPYRVETWNTPLGDTGDYEGHVAIRDAASKEICYWPDNGDDALVAHAEFVCRALNAAPQERNAVVEQCAKVCDELGKDYRPGPDAPLSTASHHTCLEAAKRIRALRDIP